MMTSIVIVVVRLSRLAEMRNVAIVMVHRSRFELRVRIHSLMKSKQPLWLSISIMDMLASSLNEQEAAYQEQKQTVELFRQSIISDKRYEPLVNLEPNIFRISVVDDLLFYIKTGAAEDMAEAMIKHKTK